MTTTVLKDPGDYTATDTDECIVIKKTAAQSTRITFPACPKGTVKTVKDGNFSLESCSCSSVNNAIESSEDAVTIDGVEEFVQTEPGQANTFVYDGDGTWQLTATNP